jgi:hypothetical protein
MDIVNQYDNVIFLDDSSVTINYDCKHIAKRILKNFTIIEDLTKVIIDEESTSNYRKSVRIYGSIMWPLIDSQAKRIEKRIIDYRCIKKYSNNQLVNISPNDTNSMHIECVRKLDDEINYCVDNNLYMIILTHYLPSYNCIHPVYSSKQVKFLNCTLASNLDYLINEPIVLWLHGHAQRQNNIIINNTRIISNSYDCHGVEKKKNKSYVIIA